MPYIHLRTNVDVDSDATLQLKSQLGQDIADLPGKSERWLMVEVEGGKALSFQGRNEPCAMVTVLIYGKADSSSKERLASHITKRCRDVLGIDEARVYVAFYETPDWAYGGSLF